MGDSLPESTHYHRQACTECQRRKQKCSREWPCNHCQKRKVADKCTFSTWTADNDRSPAALAQKRQLSLSPAARTPSRNAGDEDAGLEALGYMTNELLTNLGLESKGDPGEFLADADTCPQLDHALKILPTRQQTDLIVQSFFRTVNLHYLILYETKFISDYQVWWEIRPQRRGIGLQWTCLLLMVCACTIQQLDEQSRMRIESSLGDTADKLSDKFHSAARELGSVIPLGRYHINNVLWQLHSCYWFKAEAKFLEAWHVLGTAIREGQELGLHREASGRHLPNIQQELRRRIWCVLDTWDWQMSSGLGRPTLVDRSEVDVAQPNLALEAQPSPLHHLKLQSKLIREVASRFGAPKHVVVPSDVLEYIKMIEDWLQGFPDYFKLSPTARGNDQLPPWLVYHRYYLWTMGYLMILNPIRPYMAKTYDSTSSKADLEIYAAGLRYARELTVALDGWVNITAHRDGWFHFQIFSIFDVASMLCAAIKQDEHNMIPDRPYVFDAIDSGLNMLRKLNQVSDTVGVWHDLLSRQVKQLPRPVETAEDVQRKRTKLAASRTQVGDPYGSPRWIKPEPSESGHRTWSVNPPTDRLPHEHELPALDGHTSASLSPSSDKTVDGRNYLPVGQPLLLANDIQPQLDAFSQDIDWSFFQEFSNGPGGNSSDWMNWPNFDSEAYVAPTPARFGL